MDNVLKSATALWDLRVNNSVVFVIGTSMLFYLTIKCLIYRDQILNACFPSFALFDSRLESFKKCNIELKHDICILCESGFYYTGDGETDKMTCFSCGVELFNWEYEDHPWSQHALWSRDCKFLRICKGTHFVERIHDVNDKKTEDILNDSKLSK